MKLNTALDRDALKDAFAPEKRLQIPNFLEAGSAETLAQALQEIPWRLVLNEGEKHFDITPEQLVALTPEKYALLFAGARQRAHTQFQYIYKNYPVADIAQGSGLPNGPLKDVFKLMNSDGALSFLNHVTESTADYCDMQATRYEPGHFLTAHDDGVEGKHRHYAYVLSLSPEWKSGWGGMLEFVKPATSGLVEKSFTPAFNTLSIFAVPVLHRVTAVEPHARSPRHSLTGWFRRKH